MTNTHAALFAASTERLAADLASTTATIPDYSVVADAEIAAYAAQANYDAALAEFNAAATASLDAEFAGFTYPRIVAGERLEAARAAYFAATETLGFKR